MKFFIMVIGAGLSAFALACNDKGDADRKLDTSVIMPLRIGMKWSGTQVSKWFESDSTASQLLSYSVVDTFVESGEKWFVVKWSTAPVSYDIDWLLTNRKDGLWSCWVDPEYRSCDMAIPYARYPAAVGERFDGISYECHVRVVAVDTPVTVPAGTFGCYEYFWFDDEAADSGLVFLAPGIGWVKDVRWLMKGPMMPDRSTVWELSELKR